MARYFVSEYENMIRNKWRRNVSGLNRCLYLKKKHSPSFKKTVSNRLAQFTFVLSDSLSNKKNRGDREKIQSHFLQFDNDPQKNRIVDMAVGRGMSISVVFTKLFRSVDYEKKKERRKRKKKNFLILFYLFDLLSTRSLIGCQASLTFIGSVSRVLCYLKRNDWTFHQVDLFDTS